MITTPLVDGYYGGLFINRKEAVRVFLLIFLFYLFSKLFQERHASLCELVPRQTIPTLTAVQSSLDLSTRTP